MHRGFRDAFHQELASARRAEEESDFTRAWSHLERAHVLSQAYAWEHARVHGRMFAFAWRRRDLRELVGQVPRLLLAAPGSWTGRAPRGNTGGANVGIFAPMEIPADLEFVLRQQEAPRSRRDAGMVRLAFSTRLAASPEQVWAHASTMAGVNAELGPWLRMTHPVDRAALDGRDITPGETLFASWLLAFGVLPLDRHFLALERLLPGVGFDERSRSWTQKIWVHRRRIEADGRGARVTDTLEFESRLAFAAPLLSSVIAAIFRHRHRRLAVRFGAVP